MLLWLYRLIFLPALLVIAPSQLNRMWRRGGYRAGFGERFGRGRVLPVKVAGRPRIWLQAVSVGEMLAVGPILQAWREAGLEVYLTTTTSTGYEVARERYRSLVLGLGYFPIDWWPFVRRAWRRIEPDLLVLTEGERWPELLHRAERQRVPVVCINARMSDRSYQRMRRLGRLAPQLMPGLTRVLAASPSDAERFIALGLAPDQVRVTGNVKLDSDVVASGPEALARYRAELGLGRDARVILGSSTWPGEEAALLEAWQTARAAGEDCRLLLVPRHAERREELAELLNVAGVSHHFRSHGPAPAEVEVAVADTTGELAQLTPLADVVFVGKSLPPHQAGQTPVEAAALGRPLLMGPAMSNFRQIADELKQTGAARTVHHAADLSAQILHLLRHPAERVAMGAAGRAWHRANQGAGARTVAGIAEVLASSSG
jgi:3-deoxy-D-manno-octulosonic-acid transferase